MSRYVCILRLFAAVLRQILAIYTHIYADSVKISYRCVFKDEKMPKFRK